MATPPRPLEAATKLLATHLPTSRHAAMLFDMLVDHLGELAVVDTSGGGRLRKLHRREGPGSESITPWTEMSLSLGGHTSILLPLTEADTWGSGAPDDEAVPSKLRGLQPAELALRDGGQHISFRYGDDGRLNDRSLNDLVPGRLEGVVDALATRAAQPVELVAAYLASIVPHRHGPGRVRMPVRMPAGVEGVWNVGLFGARRALFSGRVPASARFLVVDGVAGAAVGWGATREEAITAFEAEVRRAQPRPSREAHHATDDYDDEGNLLARGEPFLPPVPDDAPRNPLGGIARIDEPSFEAQPFDPNRDSESDRFDLGTYRFHGPIPDVPMPRFTLETTPSVVLPLDPSPAAAPPLGTWIRLLGARGDTRHAARIDTPRGFTLLGEHALPHVRPSTLDADLDAADARYPLSLDDTLALRPETAPYIRFRSMSYRWTPGTAKQPAGFAVCGAGSGPRFDPAGLDGDAVADEVRRHRKVLRGSWKPY